MNLKTFNLNLTYFNLDLANFNTNLQYFKLNLEYFNLNLINFNLCLTYFNLNLKRSSLEEGEKATPSFSLAPSPLSITGSEIIDFLTGGYEPVLDSKRASEGVLLNLE